MAKEDNIVRYFIVLNRWMYLRNRDIKISSHVELEGKIIAVYGLGDLGKRLIEQLTKENIPVKYAVDVYAKSRFIDFNLFTPDEELPEADVLVVTPFCEMENITKKMEGKTKKMISLESIINELWEEAVMQQW